VDHAAPPRGVSVAAAGVPALTG